MENIYEAPKSDDEKDREIKLQKDLIWDLMQIVDIFIGNLNRNTIKLDFNNTIKLEKLLMKINGVHND